MTPIAALIVEDQEDVQRLLRAVLENADVGVVIAGTATSGPEALALIDEVEPDVVILDHMLPGMSGLDVAAEIKRRRPNQILILCSAFLDRPMTRRALELGFHDIIPKGRIERIPAAVLAACSV